MSDFFVIPKKVFEDTKLNDFTKLVFAKLLDLSTEDLCCTITNRELAEEFAKSQSTIKRAIVSSKSWLCKYKSRLSKIRLY